VRAELQDAELGLDELVATRDLISDLRSELSDRIKAYLDAERQGWRADVETLEDDEIPLRDPSTPGRDDITAWASETDHTEDVWVRAEAVGHTVAHVLNVVEEEDKQRASPAVGRTLAAWRQRDHEQYYREISLSRRFDRTEPPDSWRRAYSARLELHNCVPGDAIAERLDAFGGGVLMSATLEPTEVFRRVTGLDALEADGRPVVERTYGLTFPASNRASFAVDAPAFTYENRGGTDEDNRTRLAYVDAAARVARRGGNVLVGMPNYAEARWMAGELSERLDVPVLTDEASDDAATESLKSDFFAGDDKVLVTSLRGTLTEGVDYRGDRLNAAVVCGVPLIDTSRPLTRAVVAAYDRTFDDGFETALTVPAVRKARQAVGRVIRGPDERGVRVLLDRRYARDVWNGVREYLPAWEREEFTPVSTDMLDVALDRFESG
jgi:DNA excision repair protein ERCC-2